MFGFGWVRTHLGDVFFGKYMSFLFFWLDFWKNGQNNQNMGKLRGPTPRRRDPHAAA